MSASPKRKAFGGLALMGLIGAMIFAVSGAASATATDSSLPASKSAVSIDELIGISAAAERDSNGSSSDTTGWQDVLNTSIKTSQQKDLLFDVAMQCGIVTDSTVSSKNGGNSNSEARGTMSVRVVVDKGTAFERVAEPDSSVDANNAAAPGVVYCDRIQRLEAKFSGLNCTADPENGYAITCEDPETLRLLLKTLNANSFNFALDDVGSGVHSITVQAKADAQAIVEEGVDQDGTLSKAEAFAGAGGVVVEEVRLVKGSEIVEVD